MDFSLSSDQLELQGLARRILADACTVEHLKTVAGSESAIDTDLWRTMCDAGLVGIALPESVGGAGLTFLEACVVLAEVGRAAAPVPALAVIAMAGPALANSAHPEFAAGLADGSVIATAAIHEPTGDPWTPATVVVDGRVSGTKVCVPAGLIAHRFVVTAADGLYAVDANAPGVTVTRQDTTSGVPDALVEFVEAPAACLGNRTAVDDLLRHAMAGVCVMTGAACETAVELTAKYATTRQQFDRVIASFQAVSQRAADAYIDTEAVTLTAWQAAWRLAHGMPADEQLYAAKFWAAEGGQRVVHAAQHIHGGIGVDRDYPLHRYFLLVKQLELQLGSATPSLLRLGRLLADTPT